VAFGLLAILEGLAQHRLLDRLIRGRMWIGLVAFALIGIVTLQLGLLKLNGGIGRALEHEALLQRENAALSIENSELASGAHVDTRATRLGMAFAPQTSLHFLKAPTRADLGKAAGALSSAEHSTSSPSGSGEAGASGEAPASSESASFGETSSSGEAGAAGEDASAEAQGEPAGEAASSPESTAAAGPEAGSTGEASTSGAAASTSASSESQSTGASSAESSAGSD
jgi:hypothetical protein